MKGRSMIMLGLGVAIALVLSAGAVYGMTGQAASQRGTTALEQMTSCSGNNCGNNNNFSISPADSFLTALVGVVILSAAGVALAKRRRLNVR
jgi:hypothetical protein